MLFVMETDTAARGLIDTAGASAADPPAWATAPAHRSPVRLLALDAHGRVLTWIHWQQAACLYTRDAVAWTLGNPCLQLRGGTNRMTGQSSRLDLHPIIATRGHARLDNLPTPYLNNGALFARDAHLCLYCGTQLPRSQLTRDHVIPLSRGGDDLWENVVTACGSCNSRKANRTPAEARMPLLAVPYRPSWIEHLILSNRHILADQMAFLSTQLPRRNPRS